MLSHAIAFIAGGYVIPASMHFAGIYKSDQSASDHPSKTESFMTALLGALAWPAAWTRYEGQD